jgi:hypothetical protein
VELNPVTIKVRGYMIQADILDLIQRHGFAFPEDVVDKIASVDERIWKQSQLVTAAMIRALIQDYFLQRKSRKVNPEDLGWRNKYRIHLLSDRRLSQRTLYNEMGVIEMLVRSDFIEKREAPSSWGNQDFQYRLKLDFLPEAPTTLESIQLFIEGIDE